MKKFINSHFFTIFVIISMFLIIFISQKARSNNIPSYFDQDFQNAKIIEVVTESLESDPVIPNRKNGKQELRVEILEGEYKGQVFETTNLLSRSHNVLVKPGMKVVAGIKTDGEAPMVWIYNYKRETTVYLLGAIFFILLAILGRGQGVKSAISLIFTGVLLIFVLLPLLFAGKSAIFVSICVMSIVIVVSFLLISGYQRKTLSAIIGTIGGITAAGLISYIAGIITHLSGIDLEHGEQLAYFAQDMNLNIEGFMFAAILIASTGAVMDVAMSISSSIFEIKKTSPHISKKSLFHSGMTIGKDVMGTMSNTLILAFAGSSFTLMILIYGYQLQYLQFINLQSISIELIQGLAGSIGIILSVPITALAATLLVDHAADSSKK